MRTILLALSIAALGFAPAPVFRERPDDPEADLRRFQGSWRAVSYRNSGGYQMIDSSFRLRVEKDGWRMFAGAPPVQTNAYTITLDTRTTPMRIDWRGGGIHLEGIFTLSGDRLHYSYRSSTLGYPRSLDAPGPEDAVIEVEREK
jgi:uncharacterized protein (TIGR03067 family)